MLSIVTSDRDGAFEDWKAISTSTSRSSVVLLNLTGARCYRRNIFGFVITTPTHGECVEGFRLDGGTPRNHGLGRPGRSSLSIRYRRRVAGRCLDSDYHNGSVTPRIVAVTGLRRREGFSSGIIHPHITRKYKISPTDLTIRRTQRTHYQRYDQLKNGCEVRPRLFGDGVDRGALECPPPVRSGRLSGGSDSGNRSISSSASEKDPTVHVPASGNRSASRRVPDGRLHRT